MKKQVFGLVVVAAFWMSCTNSPKNSAPQEQETVVAEDVLYKKIMALHDESMPKIATLKGLQKKYQLRIDSLTSLKANAERIEQNKKLQNQMVVAEKAMFDWMEQFNPDPTGNDEEKISYFNQQLEAAQQMRNLVFAAIDSAANNP